MTKDSFSDADSAMHLVTICYIKTGQVHSRGKCATKTACLQFWGYALKWNTEYMAKEENI